MQYSDETPPPTGRYALIYSDPAWHFKVRSPAGEGRSANQHYDVMSLEAMKAMPVADWAAKDCMLLMWAIDPMLPEALELIDAWGFKFKTVGFYWAKTNRKSAGFFTGLGYYTRACPEQCLLATRGRPQRKAKDVQKLIVSPRREHSRKPDETIDRIERLVDGPYLEMFCRTPREGWDSYGNEVGKFSLPVAHDLIMV